ncbi:hypothetical protein [Flagellimonas onchidii]|uniref:hypothetical protein n=1 Tax=Flagellimonas onchidii TaxID=2562684 RepID=UPI0010A622E1|nr:hypothetical protein [Allomuricauda onchidii]
MASTFKLISNNWDFVAYTTGGDATTVTSIEEFYKWAKNAKWNPNVAQKPIGYKLKYLKDNSSAYIVKNTTFTKRECRPQQAYRLTFLGIGYTPHNGEDCSRIYSYISASLKEVDNSGGVRRTYNAKNSANNKLVEWGNYKSKEWPKRHHEAVSNSFKVTEFNEGKLLSQRESLTFYIDPNSENNNLLELDLNLYFKSCHKNDGISGWNCNVRMPNDKPTNKYFKIKSDLFNNSFDKKSAYFDSGYINGSQNHKWKAYFKIEKL